MGTDFIFLGSKITVDGDSSHKIKSHLLLRRRAMPNQDSILKAETSLCWQRSVYLKLWFSSSHVWMWEFDHEEGWVLKNWCFQTVLMEKTLESPLDSKEIQPVHPKGDQSWVFIGRTDAEAETPVFWPPDAKSQLTGNTVMLRKIEGRRRRGQQKMRGLAGIIDSMGMKSEQTPGNSEGQGSLACCSLWGHQELDTT